MKHNWQQDEEAEVLTDVWTPDFTTARSVLGDTFSV